MSIRPLEVKCVVTDSTESLGAYAGRDLSRVERALAAELVDASGARAREAERPRVQKLLEPIIPGDADVAVGKQLDSNRARGHDSSERGAAANSGIVDGGVPTVATTVVVMPPRTLKNPVTDIHCGSAALANSSSNRLVIAS